jgi:hypothetical protein
VINTDKNRYRYCCFSADQKILSEETINQNRQHSYGAVGMSLSNNIETLDVQLENMQKHFNRDESVIVSNEGFGNYGWATDKHIKLFDALGVPIKIFAIARPPVEWINSGWWQ